MKTQWQSVGRGKRVIALSLVVLAILLSILIRTPAEYLVSCAIFLFAWNLAFIPSPSLNVSMKDVYDAGLQGWRTPLVGKLVSLLAIVLMVAGISLQIIG